MYFTVFSFVIGHLGALTGDVVTDGVDRTSARYPASDRRPGRSLAPIRARTVPDPGLCAPRRHTETLAPPRTSATDEIPWAAPSYQ